MNLIESKGGVRNLLANYIHALAYTARDYLKSDLRKEGVTSVEVEKVGQYSRRVVVSGKKIAGSLTLTLMPAEETISLETILGTHDGASASDRTVISFGAGENDEVHAIRKSVAKAASGALRFAGESVDEPLLSTLLYQMERE